MNKKKVLTKDLFECDIPYLKKYFEKAKYPWELLPQIKGIIKDILEKGLDGYHLLKEGVLVGENVQISEFATIIPPAIIGANTEIRPGAYLRGNVIVGDNCVLGNSSEFKNLPYDKGVAIGFSIIESDLKLVDDAINEATDRMKANKELMQGDTDEEKI